MGTFVNTCTFSFAEIYQMVSIATTALVVVLALTVIKIVGRLITKRVIITLTITWLYHNRTWLLLHITWLLPFLEQQQVPTQLGVCTCFPVNFSFFANVCVFLPFLISYYVSLHSYFRVVMSVTISAWKRCSVRL